MAVGEKIIITGSKGTIGQILTKGLNEYQITGLALPENDVSKPETLNNCASGQDAIIHLAWDTKTDNAGSGKIYPQNSRMFFNVYQAALNHKVPKVIMASSVHADDYFRWQKPEKMSPYQLPKPDSPYGAHKVFMESLGRYFAGRGLEVVCVRFGGISILNTPSPDSLSEQAVFLSSQDGVSLIKAILTAKHFPGRFTICYAVSNSRNRIHDLDNPFGWMPKDSAEDFLKKN